MFGLKHKKLTFQIIQTNSIFNLLKDWEVYKAEVIDNISGKSLFGSVPNIANL